MSYTRFAVYYVPPEGALARFGARWLGWDLARGRDVIQPAVSGLDDITKSLRKYGFHATLKPPFRLVPGIGITALSDAVAQMAATCAPAVSDGLALTRLGRFLALMPTGPTDGIDRVAAQVVCDLDGFRMASTDTELARRRASGLSARQEATLMRWGYPYVMEEFRFHITLTSRLPKCDLNHWMNQLQLSLPDLPKPYIIDTIALVGERVDGRFELIQRHFLTG